MKKFLLSALVLLATVAAQAQTKSAFVHLKSGAVETIACSDIDSITFESFDLNVKATVIEAAYNGASNGVGQYVAAVSDGPMDENAYPTQAGQTVLTFYIFANKAEDGSNPQLASGTYTSGEGYTSGTLYNGQSGYLNVMHCDKMLEDGSVDGWTVDLSYGTMNVVNNNGTYTLEFKGGINERSDTYNFKDIRLTYTGEIDFYNNDPTYYEKMTGDFNFEPNNMDGYYYYSSGDTYGNYSLSFYSTPLDEYGYTCGEGEMLGVELITDPDASMDISSIAGEYSVTSLANGPYNPGTFLDGSLYYYYGYYYPLGTFLSFYDEDGYETRQYGFVTGGTAKVSVNGDNVTYDFDFIVEGDHHVKMSYTASADLIIDRTSSSASAKQNPAPKANGIRNFKKLSKTCPANRPLTLKMIKK